MACFHLTLKPSLHKNLHPDQQWIWDCSSRVLRSEESSWGRVCSVNARYIRFLYHKQSSLLLGATHAARRDRGTPSGSISHPAERSGCRLHVGPMMPPQLTPHLHGDSGLKQQAQECTGDTERQRTAECP